MTENWQSFKKIDSRRLLSVTINEDGLFTLNKNCITKIPLIEGMGINSFTDENDILLCFRKENEFDEYTRKLKLRTSTVVFSNKRFLKKMKLEKFMGGQYELKKVKVKEIGDNCYLIKIQE